ncbi:MAG: cell division protein FtsB [Patiriisocius sp.]|jgi:cell division protein FtsB
MQFGKKNNYKAYIYSRPVILVLLIIVVALGVSVFERYTVEREMSDRREHSEAELDRLDDRKVQLENRVEYLEGERGIEEEIRKNFDVAREGEQVIILVGEDEQEIQIVSAAIPEAPWYLFWR